MTASERDNWRKFETMEDSEAGSQSLSEPLEIASPAAAQRNQRDTGIERCREHTSMCC